MNSILRTSLAGGLALLTALQPTAAAGDVPLELELQATLGPRPRAGFSRFGGAVTSSGDWLVVGVRGQAPVGAVHVYRHGPGGWSPTQVLLPPPTGEPRKFGDSVAFDGETIVVGAPATGPAPGNRGAGYVYTDDDLDGVWTLQQMLEPLPDLLQNFGASAAVRGDTILLGAEGYNVHQDELSGSVYVFRRSSGTWSMEALLSSPVAEAYSWFGGSVALGDERAAVGARGVDAGGTDRGAAYTFVRAGTSWSLEAELAPPAPVDHGRFGAAVRLSSEQLVIGEPGWGLSHEGKVHVLVPEAGAWLPETVLERPSGLSSELFGEALCLDQDLLLVGAPGGLGAACLFQRRDGAWLLESAYQHPDAIEHDEFGAAVALDAGRLQAAVGAPRFDSDTGMVAALRIREEIREICFGDGSSASCPCDNIGGEGEGCANSGGSGGVLTSSGSNQVSHDDIAFHAAQLRPGQPALLFAGTSAVGGGPGLPFGDGLRCAGGSTVRLGVRTPDAGGAASWGPGLAPDGGWGPGERRYFQAWYRDPGGPCASGFNLTHAIEVRFVP